MIWFRKLNLLRRTPLTYVELIIALGVIVGGLYVLSPYLVVDVAINGAPSIVQNLASQGAIIALGVVAVLNGVAMTYGILSRKLKVRSAGMFFNILLRLYVIIVTWIAQGFFPMVWLSSAIIMLITVVCYLHVRDQIHLYNEVLK